MTKNDSFVESPNPMCNERHDAQTSLPGLVQAIVVAVRQELVDSVPALFTPLLKELIKQQRRSEGPSTHSHEDFPTQFVVNKSADIITRSTSRIDAESTLLRVAQDRESVGAVLTSTEVAQHASVNSETEVSADASGIPDKVQPCLRLRGDSRGIESRTFQSVSSMLYVSLTEAFVEEQSHEETTLRMEIESLETKEASAREHLVDLDSTYQNRRRPLECELNSLGEQIREKRTQLEELRTPAEHSLPAPGPASFRFVEQGWFVAVCNLIVCLNLVAMVVRTQVKGKTTMFAFLENLFLVWYAVELGTKAIYHQSSFLFGNVSLVWWNWLDLCVVLAGAIDQWLMPLLASSHIAINVSVLRLLRVLRLFRLLRFLKIAKAFMRSDLQWINGPAFEIFMGCVIAANSVVMALELDFPWSGWSYVENILLIIYSFELATRLKYYGWRFFTDWNDFAWNWLDVVMVVGGIFELWAEPLIRTLLSLFEGHLEHVDSGESAKLLRLLKILKILRVLRLARLLKMVHPLYLLLAGVVDSLKAMQWVILLTFLTLYACAIVFTNLLGEELLWGGRVDEGVRQYFGSVASSMFSLFKLMNGDTSVVKPITKSVAGQLLFASFTIVANWAILAILTSVVSDNMIASTNVHVKEEQRKTRERDHAQRIKRLRRIFDEIDKEGNGYMNSHEWDTLMKDNNTVHELCDATGFDAQVLNDFFHSLAKEGTRPQAKKQVEKYIDYSSFLDMLKDHDTLADKRCIWNIQSELQSLRYHLHLIEAQLL